MAQFDKYTPHIMIIGPYSTKIENKETSWRSAPMAWALLVVILRGMMGSEALTNGGS